MDQPTTIKGRAKAWLAHSHLTPRDLARMQKEGQDQAIFAALAFTGPSVDMSSNPQWVLAGFAEVTVTLLDDKHATADRLAKLQCKLQAVRAENQKRENAILDRISKLQAIDYTQEV